MNQEHLRSSDLNFLVDLQLRAEKQEVFFFEEQTFGERESPWTLHHKVTAAALAALVPATRRKVETTRAVAPHHGRLLLLSSWNVQGQKVE
jgi:hypothetical protein